uniref:Reverse transcriptase domain-containing protein n=1 Tax=Musca domestica TaxID=7370 RepID=A0A1I8M1Y5_MUSDO
MIGEIDEVAVSDEEFIDLSVEQRRKLNAIIELFPSSDRAGLERTHLVEHSIDTENSKPIKQIYYPISPAKEKIIYQGINRMLSLGVIEECPQSPWSSLRVLIVKPDKARFCVDGKKLNSVTIKDSYHLQHLQEVAQQFQKSGLTIN